MFRFISRFVDKAIGLDNPFLRWVSLFCSIFALAFTVSILLGFPLVLFGLFSWPYLLGNAIGCGIGTGLVNTIAILFLD